MNNYIKLLTLFWSLIIISKNIYLSNLEFAQLNV